MIRYPLLILAGLERGASGNGQPRTHKKRSVAHVLQKEINIEEATPIIREKLAVALTGPF